MAATGTNTSVYRSWRRSNPDLDTICRNWNLQAARLCLPTMIRREGDAQHWPLDLVHGLAELSKVTHDDHAGAERDLLRIWHIRLGKYPESDVDLIAQDVQTVLERHRYMKSKSAQKMSTREFERGLPKLDVFERPPTVRKRKRVEHWADEDDQCECKSRSRRFRPSVDSRANNDHESNAPVEGSQAPDRTLQTPSQAPLQAPPLTGYKAVLAGMEKDLRNEQQDAPKAVRTQQGNQPISVETRTNQNVNSKGPVRLAPPVPPAPPRDAERDLLASAQRRTPRIRAGADFLTSLQVPEPDGDLPPVLPIPEVVTGGLRDMLLVNQNRAQIADIMYYDALLKKRRKACEFEQSLYEDLLRKSRAISRRTVASEPSRAS